MNKIYEKENKSLIHRRVKRAQRKGHNHVVIGLIEFRGKIETIETNPGYRARVDNRNMVAVIRWKGLHAGPLSEEMLDSLCPLYDEPSSEFDF